MKLLERAMTLLALAAFCATAGAQEYPARPVKVIVPYAPGGQPDVAVRVLAQHFSTQLGQPFVAIVLPDVIARFATVGLEPVADTSPEALRTQMTQDLIKYKRVVAVSRITAE
jgi:hypothetical protein